MKRISRTSRVLHANHFVFPVIVALLICVIFDLIAWRITQRESAANTVKTAEFFTKSLDSQLKSLNAFSYDLLNSQYASALSAVPHDEQDSYDTQMRAARLTGSIFQVSAAYTLTDDILIYYPNLDRIVSRRSLLTPYHYLLLENLELLDRPEAVQTYFADIFDREDGEFYTLLQPFSDEVDCYYCRSAPSQHALSDCSRMMVIRFSRDAVRNLMAEIASSMNLQYVAMVSSDGVIYAQTGSVGSDADLRSEQELLSSIGAQSYAVQNSSVIDMRLYFLPNASETARFLSSVLWIMLAGLLAAAIVGISLALRNHFHREQYIQGILLQLGSDDKEALDTAVSDYMERTYQENLQNIRIIDRQRTMVRYSFFKELLRMNPFEQAKLDRFSSAYDVSFENDHFAIFALASAQSEHVPDRERIMEQIGYGAFEGSVVLWTRIGTIDAFLCNYNADSGDRTVVEHLRERLQELPGQIYGSGIELETPESCVQEFGRLYQVITGRQFSSAARAAQEQNLYQQLASAIASGSDRQQLLLAQLTDQLQSEKESNQSLSRRYAFLYELYNIPVLQSKTYLLDEMYRDMRAQTWVCCLRELVQPLQSEKPDQPQKNIAAEVVRIISEEYSNPQMSLSVLSGRLGVSQSYLSRIFKQEYGENISHYLSKTRVEHAKALMCSGSDNLNTIALNVGFLSDMNFIRVFKKLENETPGSFRKKNK